MRSVVCDAWLTFTEPLEGGVPCFYDDMRSTPEHPHGIVTIAYGNAIFTPSEAAALPMVHPDGTFATSAEKIAAWRVVHDDPNAAHQGWRYAARLSPLRLTRAGMGALAMARLESNDRILLAHLPDWESYPACVQLAMHSLAWACGANAHFPELFQAVTDRDFSRTEIQLHDGQQVTVCIGGAELQIHMNEWTPEGTHNAGLVPRNIANKILMRNAQRVEAFHLDPDLLDWTHDLSVAGADTQPSAVDNPASEPSVILHADPSKYLQNEPPDSSS